MRSSDYQEKLVIGTAHESMRMQFSLDPYPRGRSAVRGQNWTNCKSAVVFYNYSIRFTVEVC